MKRLLAFLILLLAINPVYALDNEDTTEKIGELTDRYNNLITNYNVPVVRWVKEFRGEFGSVYYVKVYDDTGFFGRFFKKKEEAVFYRVVIYPDGTLGAYEVQSMGQPSAAISTLEFNKFYSNSIGVDPFNTDKQKLIELGKQEVIRLAFKVNVKPGLLKFKVVGWVFSKLA